MIDRQSFAYENGKDGMRILRCYGISGRVVVPRELEGLPVTELADYAFAESQEAELGHASGLPCICGAALEELCLPDTIKRLGRYVFYNCTQFHSLSCYSNIAFMGAGGFTGCGNLAYLAMHQKEGVSCLRELLQELKQAVVEDCYWEQPQMPGVSKVNLEGQPFCRLVYPEFYEEAVENTPARIISTQTHGMGIQYRNTFRNTQIVFSEYDKLFETGKYNMDFTTMAEMSVARLSFPYGLSEASRQAYASWLRGHIKGVAEYFLEQGSKESLGWLAESFVGTREELEILVQAANQMEHTEQLSALLDTMHRRFPGKRKRFTL